MDGRLEFVATRLVRDAWMSPDTFIHNPEDAVSVFQNMTADMDREICCIVHMASSGQVINASILSVGTMQSCMVDPASIFRTALLAGASRMIMIHNHPSGSVAPSSDDRAITRRLAMIGKLMGIELLDSMIVSYQGRYSFLETEPESLSPEAMLYDLGKRASEILQGESVGEAPNPYQRVAESRKKIVDDILEKIRNGATITSALWSRAAMSPRNPISGVVYRGGNRLRLMDAAIERKYQDPRWMTFKQLSEKGYSVKKGEHGIPLEKWIFSKWVKEPDENGVMVRREVPLDRPMVNLFVVFNGEQVKGFPRYEERKSLYEEKGKLEVNSNEQIVDAMIQSSECPVHEVAQDSSFYRVNEDAIYLPLRSSFKDIEAFGHVTAHEMIHSTGAVGRLARTFGKRDILGNPDTNYCIEELRAEIGALFLTTDLGIADPEFSVSSSSGYVEYYINHLTKALERDPNILFHAAADAEKASEYLKKNLDLVLTLEKVQEEIPDRGKEKSVAVVEAVNQNEMDNDEIKKKSPMKSEKNRQVDTAFSM